MSFSETDERFMRLALDLAERGLGRVAPNPAVGCVIVSRDGSIVGRGITDSGGRPHAETVALGRAGAAAKDATAYVTLQPCTHHGQTPPCLDALIAAGITRIVFACRDHDPRVERPEALRQRLRGVSFEEGLLREKAEFLNEGFFKRVQEGRPLVALKEAHSADGRIDDVIGAGRAITGLEARRHVHLLRAKYDAILIGINTALADDPELTCRLPGMENRSPRRIVLDSKLRLPATSTLARTARLVPLTIATAASSGGEELAELGADILRLPEDKESRPDIDTLLKSLAAAGTTRLLVEGGAKTHEAFLRRGLADRLHIYRSQESLGSGPASAIKIWRETQKPRLTPLESLSFGDDVLESYAVGR